MTVRIEKDGPVWTVINSRYAEARNAVDPETARGLKEAFDAFEASEEARAAVFWGEGGAFCGGWDLKYGATMQDDAAFDRGVLELFAFGPEEEPPTMAPMGPSRMAFSKPVIAAVEGPAVAGGMELAMLADCRVMGQSAYMGVFCRRWGIPLLDGGTVRLPRLVGQGRALEIAMTGRKVPAEECLAIGLCERVVEDGQARAEAEAMAHEICRFPRQAMLGDRASIYAQAGQPVDAALRWEWDNAVNAVREEGAAGAGRFSAGMGRSGDFSDI